jgi:hypothetical protein
MKTLTFGFLSKFQVHTRFMMCLIQVVEELKAIQTEWDPKIKMIMGKSHLGHGRSVIVTEWYDDPSTGDEDGFFFLDADHTFTAEDILRVVRQEGDLNAGIYVNYHDAPTCYPLEGSFSEKAENIPLAAAATGFLFFKKNALTKIHEWMKSVEGIDRVVINDGPETVESRTIPFFKDIVEPLPDGRFFWRGEDTSFSLRAIRAGLKIRGCVTYSLGHEIPKVQFYTKPRREPKVWGDDEVVIYCGNKSPNIPELLNLVTSIQTGGLKVKIYSSLVRDEEFKRYEEFLIYDKFSNLILWGSDMLIALDSLQVPENTVIYIDKRVDKIPVKLLQLKKIIFASEEIANHFSGILSPDKCSVGF